VVPDASNGRALSEEQRGPTDEAEQGEDQRRRDGPRPKVHGPVARHWSDDVGDGPGDASDRDECPRTSRAVTERLRSPR
jgi:hypothetical protein